jgi:putative PIN family toxin of toxin-antitoxin system
MIGAVFDTNILLQAALSDVGPACACWDFVEAGSVRVWAAEATLAELEDVLHRDKLRRRLESVQLERVDRLLETFRKHITVVATPERHFFFERDIDDEIFINLAVDVDAEYLVSRDNDLLDLRIDPDFTSRFPNLRIVSPFEFLQAIRAK